MSDIPQASRRQALKLLSAIPMLPLGSMASASLLAGCGGGSDGAVVGGGTDATFVSASFNAMAAPTLTDMTTFNGLATHAMATTTVGSSLDIKLSDNSVKNYKLSYKTFFKTGELVPDGSGGTILAGGYYDINNDPISDDSVPGSERQFFSDAPDGTSLLTVPNANVPGVTGKPVFAVVQFEYTSRDLAGAAVASTANLPAADNTYGKLPSPIAVLTLDQNQTTGELKLVKYHNVDTSGVHGLWITCGASLSPWGTHLSSEEYEPDASNAGDLQYDAYHANLKDASAKKYHYGHLPEVTVNPDGTGTIKKHYCLGRISHELIQVMPDNRTALMGDDYTNGGLFMFVADNEKDLSAGTLYVAKVGTGFSIDPAAAGAALTWIKLGHATSTEVEGWADTLDSTDIMDILTADPADITYTKVFADGKPNWVKVVPGMERQAAFLETHRYANIVGGSMAFTKMEGTTVNIKDKVAYSALANIQGPMVKNDATWRTDLNVSLDKQLKAGGVLAHTMTGSQKDTLNAAINSEWVPVLTKALIVGQDIVVADDPLHLGNTAHPDHIASPDNIKFSEKMRTLFIGEDSGNHVNNFLWAYNVDTKKLSRLLSTPAGAECTGLHVVDDINGWTYIMSNFQHPGDWNGLHAVVQAGLDADVRANYNDRYAAAVGYLTADPAIKLK